jgi:hypothetical protein
MTDFLTLIAQRAIGLAPVVRPVVGSRYAPASGLPAMPIVLAEDRASEDSAERKPDLESLSEKGSFISATGRMVWPTATIDAVETAAGSIEESASPARKYQNTRSLSESKQDALAMPAKNLKTCAEPSGEELGQSSAPIIGEPTGARAQGVPRHATGVVRSGTIVPSEAGSLDSGEAVPQREETKSKPELSLSCSEPAMDVKAASAHERDAVDSSSIAPHGEEIPETNGTLHGSHDRRQSAPLELPFSSETINPEGSSEKWLEPTRHSDRYGPSSSGDANPIKQSIARDPDPHLFSSKVGDHTRAASEKIIRVTIGRVEVRAIAAPLQPVVPPTPPAPKLSLDEYLRQYNRRRQ